MELLPLRLKKAALLLVGQEPWKLPHLQLEKLEAKNPINRDSAYRLDKSDSQSIPASLDSYSHLKQEQDNKASRKLS